MKLALYITKVGIDRFAAATGFKKRTVLSWKRMDRVPKPSHARVIAAKTTLKFNDIYA